MTSTLSDRASLVQTALDNGWAVNDMGYRWTEVQKDARSVVLNYDEEGNLVSLIGSAGEGLDSLELTDKRDVRTFLRDERHRDAANARYFEVTSGPDRDFTDVWATEVRETNRDFAFVGNAHLSYDEKDLVLTLAAEARGNAQVFGSVGATVVKTVFGVELHVTWKRV